jgi:uncharacterized protein (DUF2236 family)
VGRRATAGRALTADPGIAATGSVRPGGALSTPDPGLFGPQSEAWKLDREAMLLLGAGPRALLLQIAHPLVAAGVADHSNFRADPWRRLDGTLRSYLRIVYGSTPQARGEIRRLNTLHRGISGAGYSARDPDLSLWVHATLVDSTIVSYDRWYEPMTRERQARFYQETKPIGRAFGIPEAILPADLDAFEAYVTRMLAPDGPVHASPVARELARAILRPPLAPLADLVPPIAPLARPVLARIPLGAYGWTMWPAIGLLPAATRAEFGLPWGLLERVTSAWLVRAWRAWLPIIPTAWRWMPQARAADRRIAGA